MSLRNLLVVLVLSLFLCHQVQGHGRLLEPPSRSSMWRFGYDTAPNYDDNELFCGGIYIHNVINEGKCGVCGDPFQWPQPRPNEAGGTYGRGIIVRNYSKGQVIRTTVELTANHMGYFEFKICPNNDTKHIVEQNCLDKFPLELAHRSGTRYQVESWQTGMIDIYLKLPKELTCSQCVLQWEYRGENNWGFCSNGKSKLGCGPQETFRACADVEIRN